MKIVSFYNNVEYQEHKPAVSLLLDNAFSKELRIALRNGQLMKEHKAPYPIMVQVLTGGIEFGVTGEKYQLQAGDLIALEANVPHDLLATADAIVRLTLHKADTDERVKQVIE
jgi:quercetin dioxygenase-like cupin family protein